MEIPHESMLLRIFLGELHRWHSQPLYEAIVMRARDEHLAGATVFRGPLGFGKSSRMHKTSLLRISEDIPVVVEIVDSEEKINAFLPILDEMLDSGLVTLEKVKTLSYRTRAAKS
jgi:PII-like signaling protein